MPIVLKKYYPTSKILFVIGEALFIVSSILLAMLIRFGSNYLSEGLTIDEWAKIALMASVCQLSLYYNDLYDLKVTDTYQELGLRLTRSLGMAAVVLALIYYAFPSTMLGRGIFLISITFMSTFVCSWRYVYSWTLKKRMFSENIMIIGSGELAQNIVAYITSRNDSGYQIGAVIDNPEVEPALQFESTQVFSDFADLSERARALSIGTIVVALDEKRGKLPVAQLLRCRMEGIRVVDGISFYEELAGKILVEKLRPSWLIFSDGFKQSPLTRVVNRLVNILCSLVGLIVTLPMNVLVALCIKLDSPGPVLYSQIRCGEGGRSFRLYKFRTMTCDAEEGCGPVWAVDDDPRITRVGKIIRKLRIDEIPQMWNVLVGHMSFVGPRPERPEFVEHLEPAIPYYAERHNVKPGITGWAQICHPYGATVEAAQEKLKYDLFYVKNMNLFFDLLIIFQTVKVVLLGKGAR
jgi:sugar transferase (PEP-CTERM system associated)